jgi:hypothetical protein
MASCKYATADIGSLISVKASLQTDRCPGTPANCITQVDLTLLWFIMVDAVRFYSVGLA